MDLSLIAKIAKNPFVILGGAVAALAISLGDVTESDVRKLNGAVAPAFNEPAPGKMYAVPREVDALAGLDGSPVCWYENYPALADAPRTEHRVYVNRLGEIVPLAEMLYERLGFETRAHPRLALTHHREALDGGLNGPGLDTACEAGVREAYFKRDHVACVIESVERKNGPAGPVFALKFKSFAVVPDDADEFPRCPLGEAEIGVLWPLKKLFLTYSVLDEEAAVAVAGERI